MLKNIYQDILFCNSRQTLEESSAESLHNTYNAPAQT